MIDEKHADNSRYINMISPALYIAMIDGQVVDKPRTENEILAVLDRLEEEGVYAIMQEVYGSEGSIDEVKKS
jgi:hypothetical protein